MIGIILAGGNGTRLGPLTQIISKQLNSVYDKPMIYYPLSLMMASGIRNIIIITTPRDQDMFQNLLGYGNQWGISIQYVVQLEPNGLPEAFLLCRDQIENQKTTLMLGDNIVYGSQVGYKLAQNSIKDGASIYGYLVKDTSAFGSFRIDGDGKIIAITEKPVNGGRGFAIPGIYHFDETVTERTIELKISARNELEIVDLLNSYQLDHQLSYSILDRGTAWLDTGTIDDLFMASELVRVVQSRQGMLIGSPDETAYRMGFIGEEDLLKQAQKYKGSNYGVALTEIFGERKEN
jgi:glucose-1-phosphate thymidylyltransferase